VASIGRIGEDFLVTAHGGIEYHFTNGYAAGSDCQAFENTAIFEN
jgi:hypothetical protein